MVINIKADGKTIFLKNGRDFKLSYRDNREPGTGKVLVTFMGNYSGKKTLTFAIRRLSPTPTPARITKVTPTPTATPKPVVTAKPTPTPAIVPVPETPMDGKHLTAAWYASLLEKENFVFSPYSLRDCASILYPAAGGTSKKEMEDVLGLSEAVSAALKKSDAEAIFTKGIGMKSANKAYINTLDAAMAHANTDALDTGLAEAAAERLKGAAYDPASIRQAFCTGPVFISGFSRSSSRTLSSSVMARNM